MVRLLLLSLLLAIPMAAAAQIYRSVDEQGNVVFSDQPPPAGSEGEQVELQPLNTTPAPEPRPEPAPQEEEEAAPVADYGVTITDPANETTIPMGPGNFTVSARVEPPPGPDDLLQLRLNGENRGDPQRSGIWELTNVFRGAHDITVSVLDKDGNDLVTSDPVRVYVLRPSSNFRR